MRRPRLLAVLAALGLLLTGCSSSGSADAHALGETVPVTLTDGLVIDVTVEDVTSGGTDELAERGVEPFGNSEDDTVYWFVNYTMEVTEGDMDLLRANINNFEAWTGDWAATNNRGGEMTPMKLISGGSFDCGRGNGQAGIGVEEPYLSCKIFAAPSSVTLKRVEAPGVGTWHAAE